MRTFVFITVKATALPDEVIIYSLTDSVNFTIDSNGTIRSNAKLDADLNGRLYTFNVTARVQGGSGEGMAFVRINTENRNDEPPRFEQDIYPARVDEKANPHAVVTTVVARDIDDGDKVKYGLASGDFPPGMFVVDEDSGVIRLGASQPRFDKDTYEFNITATDDGSCCPGGQNTIHTSTALVVVKIIDVNDNKPVFKECDTYKPKVKENEPVGTMVIQVDMKSLNYSRTSMKIR